VQAPGGFGSLLSLFSSSASVDVVLEDLARPLDLKERRSYYG